MCKHSSPLSVIDYWLPDVPSLNVSGGLPTAVLLLSKTTAIPSAYDQLTESLTVLLF
jgi:hypothetical protein